FHVTGVQTCALPIFRSLARRRMGGGGRSGGTIGESVVTYRLQTISQHGAAGTIQQRPAPAGRAWDGKLRDADEAPHDLGGGEAESGRAARRGRTGPR